MKTYKTLYKGLISKENFSLAYRKARKGKTKKPYIKEFNLNLSKNLAKLRTELIFHSYNLKLLEAFIVRDPKTRKISKSDFRDRIVHHAMVNILDPIFDPTFIHDSYANRKGKGSLAALQRFDKFKRKVSRNGKINGWFNNNQVKGYCLKADIKHYFQTVDHEILLTIIKRKIKDPRIIWLIKKILGNYERERERERREMRNASRQFNITIFC